MSSAAYNNPDGAIVEIDIRKYFNTIPLGPLRDILRQKITDSRFLRFLDVLMTAPSTESGVTSVNVMGCPQGSIVSPVLANVYLHYVIDEWFDAIRKTHLKARSEAIRYADDMVFIFQHRLQAEKFFKVLPKRLKKYGLDMHLNKSSLIPSGRVAMERASQVGERLPTNNGPSKLRI